MAKTFNDVSHFTMYTSEIADYKRDSRKSLFAYRFRKITNAKLFKTLVLLALPLYMLSLFGQNKEIGLVAAVGMSAALLASTTIV